MLISTVINLVRSGLGDPPEQVLGDDQIIMELWGVVALRRAQLKLTNESWIINRAWLDVPAGTTTEMNISAGDFGQAFLIRTVDTNNAYFVSRTVDIVKPEQLSMYWGGPDNLQMGGTQYSPHVAAAFAIFNENGQWKIMWKPAHLVGCRYRMWYTPGPPTVPPLFDDSTGFPIEEQNFFIIASIAINLFPRLADPEKGYNEQQKLLLEVQDRKYEEWAPVFNAQRLEGFRRETPMHRKIWGSRHVNQI